MRVGIDIRAGMAIGPHDDGEVGGIEAGADIEFLAAQASGRETVRVIGFLRAHDV